MGYVLLLANNTEVDYQFELVSRGSVTDHEIPHSKFVEEFQVEDSKCSLPGREERETNWPHVEKHLAKAMDEVEQSSTECQDNKTHHSGHKEGPTRSNAQDIRL